MPEHEIAKHTKAIYTQWTNPAHGWKHKLGEILIEILIIVFAITLSLLVERWRENAHERTVEKQFLVGLKNDLQKDLQQQEGDSLTFVSLKKGWSYYYNAGRGRQPIQQDSLAYYQWSLLNNTSFSPNNSRFEALKSSGEFGVIEDDSLQNIILDLYQNQIPSLTLSTTMFSNIKNSQIVPYLFTNLRYNNDSTNNLSNIVKQPVFQNYMSYRFNSDEVLQRYHQVMQQSRTIIHMINEQYDLKEN